MDFKAWFGIAFGQINKSTKMIDFGIFQKGSIWILGQNIIVIYFDCLCSYLELFVNNHVKLEFGIRFTRLFWFFWFGICSYSNNLMGENQFEFLRHGSDTICKDSNQTWVHYQKHKWVILANISPSKIYDKNSFNSHSISII